MPARHELSPQPYYDKDERANLDPVPNQFPHGEVVGLHKVLAVREQLPTFDAEHLHSKFDEAKPLLPLLHSKINFEIPENMGGCILKVEKISKHEEIYKVRVPVSLLPLPRFAHVDESAFVDLGILPLEELYHLGEEYHQYLAAILVALQNIETTHSLIIRGDGVICQSVMLNG
jgi:hypothetical protein